MGEWELYRIPAPDVEETAFLWSWRYRKPDGSVVSTPETFRFFLDCVAHARLNGYAGGPLRTRREPPSIARLPLTSASMRQAIGKVDSGAGRPNAA
jgi:hypothetical protein